MATLASQLVIIVINTENVNPEIFQGTNDVSYGELEEFMKENPDDFVEYDLGQYFTAQNDEDLGLHWSYLVNKSMKLILNGMYNSNL